MKIQKRDKGKNIIKFPNDYIIVDIETTGFSPLWDSILEIGALKVNNNEIVDSFHSFIAYDHEISEHTTSLTGITNSMLDGAPAPYEAIKAFKEFLGDEIIVGYNVNFDINFIYDYSLKYLNQKLSNDFIDCMRISKKLFPEMEHHRLVDMAANFSISTDGSHRAVIDCQTTKIVFDKLHSLVLSKYTNEEEFCQELKNSAVLNAKNIIAQTNEFDVSHPLYGKRCVFTGALEKMIRKDAMQIVVNIGGLVENNVTKKTNFLILGNNEYCKSIKDGKSNKLKKAEELIEKGQDLIIISEEEFYDMVLTYNDSLDLKAKDESETFGCCSQYKQCSDAKKCLRDDDRSNSCLYRKNLEDGKIFY